MQIWLPQFSLVLLVGCAGSGKTTFARRWFRPTEVLSSDHFRAMISDDENDQSATKGAFEVLHLLARRRLSRGLLTVVDATNLEASARRPLLQMARKFNCPVVALTLPTSLDVLRQRNQTRSERTLPDAVLIKHHRRFSQALGVLPGEVDALHNLNDEVSVHRSPAPMDLRHDQGPFDIVGDVHGCYQELRELLGKLGYQLDEDTLRITSPPGRKLLFLGDLADRGPNSLEVLRLVSQAVENGVALMVLGNHDAKLLRWLQGAQVGMRHGLSETVAQLETASDAVRTQIREMLAQAPTHVILDEGRLVAAHAGLRESFIGRASGAARAFALYGDVVGGLDEQGLPRRRDWAASYQGEALMVYGHTPVATARWRNRTLCLDTGCVFGGVLTALRYPERRLVTVAAKQVYQNQGDAS